MASSSFFIKFFFHILCLARIGAAALTSIDRTGWTATADSFEVGNEAGKALDGDGNTFWHTRYTPTIDKLPHWIVVDMKATYNVQAVTIAPRPGRIPNGIIGQHQIEVSVDNKSWTVVAVGTYDNNPVVMKTTFVTRPARYVRITAFSEAQTRRNQWTSISELNVLHDPAVAYTAPSAGKGLWQQTVDFPLIPAAVSLLSNGKVLIWSAFAKDSFGGSRGYTQTGMYDPATGESTQMNVTNTGHDMFCPGISTDFNGNIVITGGSNAARTTTYDPVGNAWISAPNMKVARGYQSSTTCSDGRIFTIGGSWSGGRGGKNGEIYDPKTNAWTMLPNALVSPMLTTDAAGAWRSDNHAWLFGWKNGFVFQAGPSIAMNWYDTAGSGTTSAAGKRLDAEDSMNGIAVMYDAVAGKILAAGGAPDYQDTNAHNNAYVITIGAPKTNPTVTRTQSMAYARSFSNGIVLPDGKVLVTGGQAYAKPFVDTTAAMSPELWDPATGVWTQMNPMAIPRTYHSTAILLPDATVLNGGGGVCGNCKAYGGTRDSNHFDAEIFVPPYLLNADGTRRARPDITGVAGSVKIGATLSITTSGAVSGFSLVRTGTATHTVNTDQRRIPLTASSAKGTTYTVTVPEDPGVALPGYWLLFALDAKGTPSVGKFVKLTL